jgi:hypothetical protein
MTDAFSKAAAVLRRCPEASDLEIYRTLVDDGIASHLAARLVEFMPMIYCRLLLEPSGVRFSPSFQRRLADGSVASIRPLVAEPAWGSALSYARREIESGVPSEQLLAIAGRSTEFSAINQLLHSGARLENLVLGIPVLLWPDEGPEFLAVQS